MNIFAEDKENCDKIDSIVENAKISAFSRKKWFIVFDIVKNKSLRPRKR